MSQAARANAKTSATASAADARAAITPGMPAHRAIALLFDRYGPRLHAVASRICGHTADAQDMVQDVFLQAFRKWHTFQGRADAGTWLYTIAARSCKDRSRRRGGIDRRTPAISQLMPWAETTVMKVAASPPSAAGNPERREAVDAVRREIARLPEHLRLPLLLKEVLELSVDDTAAALGLAKNTIKTRVHRARLALRKAMTARAARIDAPSPIFERQVCLDLMKAKMAAMDRGGAAAGFVVPQAEMCARCRAVFRELDLVQDACTQLGDGSMPPGLRRAILKAISERDTAQRAADKAPRRGRRPVQAAARTR